MFLKKIFNIIDLIFYFIVSIFSSNFQIIPYIFYKKDQINPEIIDYHYSLKNEWWLLLFSNMITTTPVSYTLDIDEEKHILKIHILDKKLTRSVRESVILLEKKIKEI